MKTKIFIIFKGDTLATKCELGDKDSFFSRKKKEGYETCRGYARPIDRISGQIDYKDSGKRKKRRPCHVFEPYGLPGSLTLLAKNDCFKAKHRIGGTGEASILCNLVLMSGRL